MTPDDFRALALALPEAIESQHMGHPDFRVRNKVFASLSLDKELNDLGMVKLTPQQQHDVVERHPKSFHPVPGGWGQRGATYISLEKAKPGHVRPALEAAWRNTAPAKLAATLQSDD